MFRSRVWPTKWISFKSINICINTNQLDHLEYYDTYSIHTHFIQGWNFTLWNIPPLFRSHVWPNYMGMFSNCKDIYHLIDHLLWNINSNWYKDNFITLFFFLIAWFHFLNPYFGFFFTFEIFAAACSVGTIMLLSLLVVKHSFNVIL